MALSGYIEEGLGETFPTIEKLGAYVRECGYRIIRYCKDSVLTDDGLIVGLDGSVRRAKRNR